MSQFSEAALTSKAWPFEEARKVLKRYEKAPPEKGYVLFETGYGPSGHTHIGTFGEVARTTMVMRAFREISDIPTKLICFSDDLDGMRKIPGNVPHPERLEEHLQKPLTSVPDPFENTRALVIITMLCYGGFWINFALNTSSIPRRTFTDQVSSTKLS